MECEDEMELTLSDFDTDKASHILTLLKSWRTFTVITSKVLLNFARYLYKSLYVEL